MLNQFGIALLASPDQKKLNDTTYAIDTQVGQWKPAGLTDFCRVPLDFLFYGCITTIVDNEGRYIKTLLYH